MYIVQLQQISVQYGVRVIFRDLDWSIDHQDRVGLIGPNGAGKSSILRLIAGINTPDKGTVWRLRGIRYGYLPQDTDFPPELTLIEAALQLPDSLKGIDGQLHVVESRLADPDVYGDEARLTKTLDEQDRLLAEYERLGGTRFAAEVKKHLAALGFSEDDYDLPAETLSGGQKKLVMLANLAAGAPDLLLLDEPDNHLDLQGKAFLERFIRSYGGAVVVVSHDRAMLDAVVTHIAELENGKLATFKGTYTAYTAHKDLMRMRQQQLYVAQQKEIAGIEAAIKRFEEWASRVVDERHFKQARSRRKMLERMRDSGEMIEKVTESRRIGLEIAGWRGSTEALRLKQIAAAFDENLIFCDVDLTLRHGERVGLIGPNGAGKSLLFRIILGQMDPYEGTVYIGPSTKVGYYSQEHQTLADWLERTPLDLIRRSGIGNEGNAVSFLLRLLFQYEQMRQPISTLSGGERSRLQLALLMLQQPNLLLLDEPTNNLDIASVEVLEAALDDFEGSVLVISHDRYFLDRVVDTVVELDGDLTPYAGGYSDYLEATGRAPG